MYDLPGGKDYGGIPARPVREWKKEIVIIDRLVKNRKWLKDE
jgi:UDP-3-O-[3-hydroxymyristoyl] glucosamine N-acyltransferase